MQEITTPISKRVSIVERISWVKDMTPAEIELFAKHLETCRAYKGEAIFVEGDHSPYLVIILKGVIRIFKEDIPNGKNQTIALLRSGKVVGEMSMMDGSPRSASAVAEEDTVFFRMSHNKFHGILQEYPQLGVKLCLQLGRMLSARLRQTSGHFIEYLQREDEQTESLASEHTLLDLDARLTAAPKPAPAALLPDPPAPRLAPPTNKPKPLSTSRPPDPLEMIKVINYLYKRVEELENML